MKHDSVDSLLKKVKKEKLLVNNLFEHDIGTWQANLRDTNGNCTNYGFGKNPQEALNNALADTPRLAHLTETRRHVQLTATATIIAATKQGRKPRRRVRLD